MNLAIHIQRIILLCCVLLLPGCMNHLFYKPNQIIYQMPQFREDVFFKTKGGLKLHGWFFPAKGEALGTIIHFHGNFGNITYQFKQIEWMPGEGFNVFMFDYRGYGKSDGSPGRKGLYFDSVAAIEYVISRSDIDIENLFIFGQSLGGANSIAAVAMNDFSGIRAVVIEGVFSSYRREARERMAIHTLKNIGAVPCLSLQIWPVSFLLVSDGFSPVDLIDQIAPTPLLVIHGTADNMVDYSHGQRLYEMATEPKFLWTVPNGSHLKTFTEGAFSNDYRKKVIDFFKHHGKYE